MLRHLTVLASLLLALAPCACEADPSSDHDNPGSRVPLNPTRPQPTEGGTALVQRVELPGQYASALEISGGKWTGIGPRQVIEVTFRAEGMVGLGQFDFTMTTDPPLALDVENSQFAPTPPFVTLGAGIERSGESGVRFIGANLQRNSNGAGELGTLRLRTPASFADTTRVRLAVTAFSVGPSTTQRDTYPPPELHLGVVVNQP